ncbi:hypothetical protein FB451DRAFT_1400410 [Mycena latifolia]|nr:hypothetical protein FB451DRAFT_1400410 [Mycena latifolia]
MESFPPRRSTPIALHSLRITSLRYIADLLMHNRCPLDISHLALVRMAVLPDGWQVALSTLSTIATPNCTRKIVVHTTLINRLFSGRLESQLKSLSKHGVITLELEIDSTRGDLTDYNLDEYLTSRNIAGAPVALPILTS